MNRTFGSLDGVYQIAKLPGYAADVLRPVHTRELAPAARSCNSLPEQSSLVCTNDF